MNRVPVRVLIAVARVAIALHDGDVRRIGAELVGDQRGQRAAHALPHLGAVARDRDLAGRRDPDEDVRLNIQESAEAIVPSIWGRRAEP